MISLNLIAYILETGKFEMRVSWGASWVIWTRVMHLLAGSVS